MSDITATTAVPDADAGQGVFCFTDLAGEQRNSIYRHLFDDITTSDKQFHVWKEREGLPRYKDLPTYTALQLTSKQVKGEVESIFDQEYLPHMTFYFDNLSKLRKLSDPTVDNILKRSGARFLLRSPTRPGNFDLEAVALMFGPDVCNLDHLWSQDPSRRKWLSATEEDYIISWWERDGMVMSRWRACKSNIAIRYEFYRLRMPTSEISAIQFKRHVQDREESTTIVETRFRDIPWRGCTVSNFGLHFDIADARWRKALAKREENLASWVDDEHSLPAMEDLW